MTTKAEKQELLNIYAPILKPLVDEAGVAYGSRATESHAHEVSREFTRLLVEYTSRGGSLLMLGDVIGITYPALRRRVMTSSIPALTRSRKSSATSADYSQAVEYLNESKTHGTEIYHSAIYNLYKKGISLNKLAKEMGLKSAYPLYYGLNKMRLHLANESVTTEEF